MSTKKKKYDVVIAGGGIAGVSCAYNCAKLNLKTLLVEKENYLGGDITGSLVVSVMKCDMGNLNQDFYNELIKSAKESGAQIEYEDKNPAWFNPIILKNTLDTILIKKGVDILFEAEISDVSVFENYINEVKIFTGLLSLPIVSNYFVDTTGDASFSKLLNCELWQDTQRKQPPSLRFIISGVDLEELKNFLDNLDDDKNVTTTYRIDRDIHLSTACTWDNSKKWALKPYFTEAVNAGILEPSDEAYFQIFTVAHMPNSVAFNCPRLADYNANNPFEYSKRLIEARSSILRLHSFVKNYIPGFKNSFISNIADMLGIRDSRRIEGEKIFTKSDILSGNIVDRPVLHADYPIDIHTYEKDTSTLQKTVDYELPFECLKASGYKNLFLAGRNISADFSAQAALRIQTSCFSMGEAVAKHVRSLV